MSDQKPLKSAADYAQYKEKLVKDALSKTKFRPRPQTPEEALLQKAMDITSAIRQHIKPVLAAGGGFDKDYLRTLVCTLYVQSFDALSKDEVVNICTMLHVDLFMETVEAAPNGADKPDLMSGV